MKDNLVTYTIERGIATLIINNPPMNPISVPVRERLISVLGELDSKKNKIGVLIVTGKGKAFVSGADIKSFGDLTEEKARERLKRSRFMYQMVENFEKPSICAINGFCLGAGLELAMCCDLRIAASTSKLGLPEINLGIIPGGGGTQRLPRLVGPGIAKELIFTGELINAETATKIGLVNKVVEPEHLIEEAVKIAEIIVKKAPLAMRAAKKVISRGLDLSLPDGLELEAYHWSYLCGTEDQKEGVRAFIEKRRPSFRGR